MFAVFAVTLLCWLSLSQSAPLACEDLVQPLDEPHPEGTWTLVAGSLANPAHLETFRTKDSAAVHFIKGTSQHSMKHAVNINGSCQHLHSNITLEGSSFSFPEFNATVTFMNTSCPDCLVIRFDSESKELERVYLISKRREVEQSEMEEFKAQVECLKMPPPVVMDPTKEVCQMASDPEAPTEGTTEEQPVA